MAAIMDLCWSEFPHTFASGMWAKICINPSWKINLLRNKDSTKNGHGSAQNDTNNGLV